jgi:hypothetical protein
MVGELSAFVVAWLAEITLVMYLLYFALVEYVWRAPSAKSFKTGAADRNSTLLNVVHQVSSFFIPYIWHKSGMNWLDASLGLNYPRGQPGSSCDFYVALLLLSSQVGAILLRRWAMLTLGRKLFFFFSLHLVYI